MSNPKTSYVNASDSSLAAMIGKNVFFGIVASGATIGTRLITVPVVIHYLGLNGYGIWSVIMVMAAYMRFGSAGVKSAFQKYVAEASVSGRFGTANKLLSTGSIIMLALSLAGIVPFAIYSKTIAISAGVPQEFVSAAASSITVLASIYVASNFGAGFEAIVMGGNRIDLTRKFNTTLTVCEAIAIIVLLHCGYGLLAMTFVMGGSELVYIFCCYKASHRVVPRMQIRIAHFTKSVFPELLRFAGSYQLVNVLELLYGAILPIIVLKVFGARSAGALAVTAKVVGSALIAEDALVLPILSSASIVFAGDSRERMRRFLAKSFKVTLAASLPPLACVAAFGPTMILAWTGQTDPLFRTAIWFCALAAFLKAVSLLQLILYRASGRASLDNIRQVLRIAAILAVALFSRKLGFNGVLAGMAGAELIGVVFMLFAMEYTFEAFSARAFLKDVLRISVASAMIVGSGALAALVPISQNGGGRWSAAVRLGQIAVGCLMMAWPALALTKSVSDVEKHTVIAALSLRGRAAVSVSE